MNQVQVLKQGFQSDEEADLVTKATGISSQFHVKACASEGPRSVIIARYLCNCSLEYIVKLFLCAL